MKVLLTLNDYAKYPFLPEAFNRIKENRLTLDELGEGELGREVLGEAVERVKKVIRDRVYPAPLEDPDLEVAVFMTSLILAAAVSDRVLWERVAVAFSKRTSVFLEAEDSAKIVYIGWRIAGWQVVLEEEGAKMFFRDFIEYAPEYSGKWKLVNRVLSGGYLFVDKVELARLAETAVKKYVYKLLESVKIDYESLPQSFFAAIEEVSREWAARRREFTLIGVKISSKETPKYFPPCIQAIVEALKSGKNLPHSARFALAAFLSNIGYSVDEMLEIFRLSPDFREDIARYQIEHIAGLRGSRTKYTPYKCDNMRSLGLCRWRCEGVKHPLQFFYRALRGRRPRVVEEA